MKRSYLQYAPYAIDFAKRAYRSYNAIRSTFPNKKRRSQYKPYTKKQNETKRQQDVDKFTNTMVPGDTVKVLYKKPYINSRKQKRPSIKKRKWLKFKRTIKKALKQKYLRHSYILNFTSTPTFNFVGEGAAAFDGATPYNSSLHQQTFPDSRTLISASTINGLYVGQGKSTTRGIGLIEGLFDNTGLVDNATAANGQWGRKINFYFKETLELTWQIQSNQLSTFTADNPLIVDIYECVATRNCDDSAFDHPLDVTTSFRTGGAQEYYDSNVAGIDNLKMTTCGATPWDFPNFDKYWKVVKTERYTITATTSVDENVPGEDAISQSYHYVLKTKGYYTDRLFSENLNIKGVTKTIFFVLSPKALMNNVLDPGIITLKYSGFKKFNIRALPHLTASQAYCATSNIAF